MKILAIDPAEITGWAIGQKGKTSTSFTKLHNLYGIWQFKLKRDESFSMKLIRFRSKITEMIQLEKPDVIVFERPSGIRSAALMSHAKFVAVIEMFCTDNDIPYKGYSAKEIKKFATGNGNCKKTEMIKAAMKKLFYKGADDNEADALWLLELAKNDLQFI